MKKTRKVFMVIAMTLASLILLYKDTKYMESVLWYANVRDAMKYANELAYQVGWTDHIRDMYNEAEEYLNKSKDPVIIMIRTHNIRMKFYTVWVVCRMVLCVFWNIAMLRLMQLKIRRCIRRKKRKNGRKKER